LKEKEEEDGKRDQPWTDFEEDNDKGTIIGKTR